MRFNIEYLIKHRSSLECNIDYRFVTSEQSLAVLHGQSNDKTGHIASPLDERRTCLTIIMLKWPRSLKDCHNDWEGGVRRGV